MRHRVDGIPVQDSEVVIAVDETTSVRELYSTYTGDSRIGGEWSLDTAEAAKRGPAVVERLKAQASDVEKIYVK
jgi:hypothetical protein